MVQLPQHFRLGCGLPSAAPAPANGTEMRSRLSEQSFTQAKTSVGPDLITQILQLLRSYSWDKPLVSLFLS